MRRALIASGLALVLCWIASPASAERYVVPFYALNLRGIDGPWSTLVTVINPNAFPVTIRIPRVFPLGRQCTTCSHPPAEDTIPPFGARTNIAPPIYDRPIAAAFEIESSAPIVVHQVAYGPGNPEIRQRMDVARRWLAPGVHTISGTERPSRIWRVNVFVTNPTDEPLNVVTWMVRGLEVATTVAPRTSAALTLPRCACGVTTEYPPYPLKVYVEGDGEFLASVSTVDESWAMFVLADAAR